MKTSEYLKQNGWKELADPFSKDCRSFFKRFDTPTRCYCNDDKEGMQVCIRVSDWSKFPGAGRTDESYEIELAGELADGTWIKFSQWGMPNDIEEGIKTIPRMLTLWENAAKPASNAKLLDWNNPEFAVKRAEDMSKISVYKWFAVKRKIPIEGDINYTTIQEFELEYYKGWEVI